MPEERERRYEGGSPVDTTRANSSPEELAREDAAQNEDRKKPNGSRRRRKRLG